MFPYNQQVANLLGYSTITNDSRHLQGNVNYMKHVTASPLRLVWPHKLHSRRPQPVIASSDFTFNLTI